MGQHLTTQHASMPHLDGYLKCIKDEFGRLNHELHETRKQRNELITKNRLQAKELRELRQTIARLKNMTASQHGQIITHASGLPDSNAPLVLPVSSFSEYYSTFDGGDATSDRLNNPENPKEIGHLEGKRYQEGGQNEIDIAPTITGTASQSHQANVIPANKPGYSEWEVGSNCNSTAALNLNLVHKLAHRGGRRVIFSLDGKYLATASGRGMVSIFDSKCGKKIMHNVMNDLYHVGNPLPEYLCLGFSPDGKYLATGEEEGIVRVWMASQRRVINTFRHQGSVVALNFSPNGRCIVTCSDDMKVIVWRLRDGSSRVLTASKLYPWSVRFSLDGRYIASGDGLGKLSIWNVRTGNLVARWRGHSDLVSSLVFTPDGKRLLSGSWDKQVKLWDVSSLGKVKPPIYGMVEISRLIGHTDSVTTVSISPDGKWIASGSRDYSVRIWNAHDATLNCILRRSGWVWSAEFSPVGNCLAIGGNFKDVTIWNYVNP